MSLLIAMPGPEPTDTAADAPVIRESLPALPELSAMLTRARRLADARDWRCGVLAALGLSDAGAVSPAAVAARAIAPLPQGTALCFAAPLHVVAGMSRVHLPPGGWLRLDAGEAGRWREAFNREFGGPDLHLHAAGADWLLASSCAVAARDAAPEELIGQPLARAPARDEAERSLRRLGAEVEIWLASHPLNREREARDLPPLNALWFWGGAQSVHIEPLSHRPRAVVVAGDADAWLTGIGAHCSLPVVAASSWELLPLKGETLLILAPPRTGLSAGHWHRLESQWLSPAAKALKAGEITALRLQIGATAWQLPDSSPLRWLRRRRPWYRQVAA
jgi:hypothetical protein